MPSLSLYLLGTFRAYLDGKPVDNFDTNKARGLLAYLAVERRPHERLRLAGLLWPDWPEARARTYLRQALLNLRHVIEPPGLASPFLLSSRHTIAFNPDGDHWVDAAALADALAILPQLSENSTAPATLQRLEAAVDLTRNSVIAESPRRG